MLCDNCGSGLPFLTESGKSLIEPAGSLNEEPSKKLDTQMFCAEQAERHKIGAIFANFSGFPK